MRLNTAELNLRADSNLSDASLDKASEMDLYNDLLAFSSLSPDEQNAVMTRPETSNVIDLPAQSQVEISEPGTVREQQQTFEPAEERLPQTAGQPPPQASAAPFIGPAKPVFDLAEEIAFEMAQECADEPVEEMAQVEEKATEPAREPVVELQRTDAFDKNDSADFQLAEILRVTGPLAKFPTKQDMASSSLACAECGCLNDNEDLFCSTCGGLLGEAENAALLSCDDCGSAVAADEIFCPSCGSVMSGA